MNPEIERLDKEIGEGADSVTYRGVEILVTDLENSRGEKIGWQYSWGTSVQGGCNRNLAETLENIDNDSD